MTLISLRLDEKLCAAVDGVRGDESRSAWIRGAVEDKLGGKAAAAGVSVSLDAITEPHREEVEALKAAREKMKKPVKEVIAAAPAPVKPAAEVRYRCKVQSCSFTARSPKAGCPSHPGVLIPI